jgi:hypothetical protein
MTAPDFALMSDVELAEAAAERMGHELSVERVIGGKLRVFRIRDFDPANDLRHAAEFGNAFLAAHPSCYLVVEVGRLRDSVSVYGANNQAISRVFGVNASEARARTVAVLTAWAALNG